MKELRFTTKNNNLYINNILNPSVLLSPGAKYNIVSEIPISITRKDKTKYDINNTSTTLITPYEPETLYYNHESIVGEIKIVKYNKKLLDAIKNENTEEIKEELESGDLNPNYIDPVRNTSVLGLAISKNLPDVVKKLIEKGADVNLKSQLIWPIFISVGRSNIEITQLLINNGAYLESTNSYGETVFLHALYYGSSYEMIEFLINNGADYFVVDNKGRTALHSLLSGYFRSEKETLRILKLLLEYGLDPDIEDNDNTKPIDITRSRFQVYRINEPGYNELLEIINLLENNPYGQPSGKSAAKT